MSPVMSLSKRRAVDVATPFQNHTAATNRTIAHRYPPRYLQPTAAQDCSAHQFTTTIIASHHLRWPANDVRYRWNDQSANATY